MAKEKIDQLKQELIKPAVERMEPEQRKQFERSIREKIQAEKDQWAKAHRQLTEKQGSADRLYSLGPKGVEYCLGIMHEKGSWDIKDEQMYHYVGVNGILTRLINVYGRVLLNGFFLRKQQISLSELGKSFEKTNGPKIQSWPQRKNAK